MVVPKPKEERTSYFRRSIESWIMVALAGHVIETRYLKDLSTGPSSDLRGATTRAIYYVSQWAMGPTKVVVPLTAGQLPPGPYLVAANELLDQLYAETERVILQKMTAVHYVARALIERDELIGDELEEVFKEAEAVDPTLTRPFERKLLQFRAFMPPQPARDGAGEWQPTTAAAAASEPAASMGPEPAATGTEDLVWPEPPEDWMDAIWAPRPSPEDPIFHE